VLNSSLFGSAVTTWNPLVITQTSLRTDGNIETKAHSLLQFLQIASLPILGESATSLLMLRLGQLFDQRFENGARSAPRIFFDSKLSLENICNRRNGRTEVLRHYSDTGKKIFLETSLELRLESQTRSPGTWNIFAGEIAVSEVLELCFDLRHPRRILAEWSDSFLMDSFGASIFSSRNI
jgi:hypothetical protein